MSSHSIPDIKFGSKSGLDFAIYETLKICVVYITWSTKEGYTSIYCIL